MNTELVMLAQTFAEDLVSGYPLDLEPKLDGIRCRVVCANGDVRFTSREGIVLTSLSHLKPVFEPLANSGVTLDGEALINGARNFNEAQSGIMSEAPAKNAHIVFFDVQGPGDSRARRKRLEGLLPKHPAVSLILRTEAKCREDIDTFYKAVVAMGYPFEGAMIKRPGSAYVLKRDSAWLKMKPANTEDARIVDAYEGKGHLRGSLGGFVVVKGDGVPIKVGTGRGLTDKKRKELWLRWMAGELRDCMCEVRSQSQNGNGKLVFPVLVRLLEDRRAPEARPALKLVVNT